MTCPETKDLAFILVTVPYTSACAFMFAAVLYDLISAPLGDSYSYREIAMGCSLLGTVFLGLAVTLFRSWGC